MSAGQVFAVVVVLLGVSSPFIALAAYCFGWWWRGRHERKVRGDG